MVLTTVQETMQPCLGIIQEFKLNFMHQSRNSSYQRLGTFQLSYSTIPKSAHRDQEHRLGGLETSTWDSRAVCTETRGHLFSLPLTEHRLWGPAPFPPGLSPSFAPTHNSLACWLLQSHPALGFIISLSWKKSSALTGSWTGFLCTPY